MRKTARITWILAAVLWPVVTYDRASAGWLPQPTGGSVILKSLRADGSPVTSEAKTVRTKGQRVS